MPKDNEKRRGEVWWNEIDTFGGARDGGDGGLCCCLDASERVGSQARFETLPHHHG